MSRACGKPLGNWSGKTSAYDFNKASRSGASSADDCGSCSMTGLLLFFFFLPRLLRVVDVAVDGIGVHDYSVAASYSLATARISSCVGSSNSGKGTPPADVTSAGS